MQALKCSLFLGLLPDSTAKLQYLVILLSEKLTGKEGHRAPTSHHRLGAPAHCWSQRLSEWSFSWRRCQQRLW